MSWLFDDVFEHRDEAQTVLDRVRKARSELKIRYERIDEFTWVERGRKSETSNTTMMTENTVTRQEAEQAIAIYRTAKTAKQESEAQMAAAERIIERFGRMHIDEFADGRLVLDSGTLAVRAGTAKPVKDGRSLGAAARSELAARLPSAYVRLSCDFAGLYGCRDKLVRQLLASRGIEIVREDKFVVL